MQAGGEKLTDRVYNEPQVALFSGGAVYDHPIEVPAGRGGLQPALNLSYNSRRVDGITGWVESDWAGMGWSMDLMDIVREGLECVVHDQTVFIHYANRFSLLMNGTSYELEPDPGVGAGQPGRYHVKDAPSLYVILEDDAPYPGEGGNVTGLYWIVKTPDGTRYRLGYSTNSEQVLWPTPNGEGWYNGGVKDSGREKNYTTFRWRLDEATDVYSNTMQVTYREAQGGHQEKRDTASVLHEVEYNSMGGGQWAAKVVFNPNGPNFGPQPDYDDRRILGSQGQLDRIEVWHGGQLVRVRYYDLEYDNTTTPANTTIRRLISIQQFSGDGQQSLPATTLDYEDKWNKDKCNPADPECDTDWELESFPYPRLVEVENGYGGKTGFNYVDDGRGGWWGAFYNYRVSGRHIYDGLDTDPARVITYTYGTMCYDQTSNNSNDYPPGMMAKCTGRSAPYVGPLVGHAWVTETLYSDDTPLVETAHHFYTDTNHSWRLGREYETQVYPGQGELLQQADITWDSMTISNTTFAHVDQVVTTDYSGGATVSTRVDYDYDSYGNLTLQREYADANPYRTSRWWYYPNETDHIVDRVASAGVYVGEGWDMADATWYFYDDNASPTQSPGSKGELTRVARLEIIDPGEVPGDPWQGCVHAYRTSEVEYDYDDYGNTTETIAYAGYGYMCQDSNWNVLDRDWDTAKKPSQSQTTQTFYDNTLRTLPIEQTNAISHTTYWYYYGVNGTTPAPAGGLFGKLERVRDPNDEDTGYRYDVFGRLTKVIQPGDSDDKPTMLYVYYDDNLEPRTPANRVTWQKRDPNASPWTAGGTWSREFFDGLGRLIQVQTPYQDWNGGAAGQHDVVRFITYDHQGLKASESVAYLKDAYVYDGNCEGTGRACNPYVDPNLNQPQTHYSYDALGRTTTITYTDGTALTTWYNGWQQAVIDPNGHMKVDRDDAFGRLTAVKEFSGTHSSPIWADQHALLYATTAYTYSVLDNLTTVTDTVDNVTTMGYDMLGRKTSMADPDMGAWSYDYDAVGNLTSQTDAKNQTIAFTYDTLNRLTLKDLPTGTDVQYYYDEAGYGKSKGKRTQMTDGSGSTKYYYNNDDRGRLTKEEKAISGGGTFVTQWSYYADDQVWTMTYPGGNDEQTGETVTNAYNPMGLVKSVTGTNVYVGDTTYNALGQVTERRLGSTSGVLRQLYTYTVTANFRLTALSSGPSPNYNDRQNIIYTYDDVGNILAITDTAAVSGTQTQEFTYDFLDRLLSAEVTDGSNGQYSESYEYSGNGGKIGNLTFKTGVGGSGSYLYDAPVSGCSAGTPSTKPHAVRQAGSYTFTYDCNGNLVQRNVGSSYTLTYDTENHLTGVSGGASASFVYDGDGNRVKATLGVSTTVYVGDYFEWKGSTSNMVKYYYANGQRVAMREGSDTLHYLLTDHLGSTAITADSNGARVAELRYKAWGENRYTDGTTPTTYRFTGQRLDESTGLMYYGARYYDAALGRFVQADTIVPEPGNPQALNRYSYVLNNPLRYTDPSGHTVRSALDLIRRYREDIKSIAQNHNIDPLLLAGVVFAENRNDYNWIRGQDWSSIFGGGRFGGPEAKNLVSPFLNNNPAIGITEVSLAVAAMMDNPELVPANYGEMSYEERTEFKNQLAMDLPSGERLRILLNLGDAKKSLEYSAKYLNFLAEYRDYGDNYALWLSDYNRGLSEWDTTSEYGRRIEVYRENIEHVLNWQESNWLSICMGITGCAIYFDHLIYGPLP